MLFYDVDLFGGGPKPEPVSDVAYAERVEIYNRLVPIYKRRLKKALGAKQARDVDKTMKGMLDRDAYGDLDNGDWSAMLHAILEAHCHAAIINMIRYTPKKYRHEWTIEELEKMMDDCELNEHDRKLVLESAQRYCPYLTDAIAAVGA